MSSSIVVPRSTAPFLASLPWFTDTIMRNTVLLPLELQEEYHVSVFVFVFAFEQVLTKPSFLFNN